MPIHKQSNAAVITARHTNKAGTNTDVTALWTNKAGTAVLVQNFQKDIVTDRVNDTV